MVKLGKKLVMARGLDQNSGKEKGKRSIAKDNTKIVGQYRTMVKVAKKES